MENGFIAARLRRVAQGQKLGPEMDAQIVQEDWYEKAVEAARLALANDREQIHRRKEYSRKIARHKAMIARVDARRLAAMKEEMRGKTMFSYESLDDDENGDLRALQDGGQSPIPPDTEQVTQIRGDRNGPNFAQLSTMEDQERRRQSW
jgi:hypothetical protein